MPSAALSTNNLLQPPAAEQFVQWDKAAHGRRFMLFVDTEEEFDWLAPFDRMATAVTHASALAEGQAYFTASGVRPIYLADYPILQSDAAAALLRQWLADGTADVGAHLHPWVTPPHEEDVCVYNSFAGNLPAALEKAKLAQHVEYSEARLGERPLVYRAGRYGIGPHTGPALADLGFALDCSIRSRFAYTLQGGPDFLEMPVRPYRTGPDGALIELPLSTGFTGPLRSLGDRLHKRVRRHDRVAAVLSRGGLFGRVPLTPEDVTADQCIAAIDALIEEDVPVLSFSFHSPTLAPGHTFYTRTAADLDRFYRWWDAVQDHLAKRSVRPIGLAAFLTACGGEGRTKACQAA